MVGKRGTKKGYTPPLVSIAVSKALLLLLTLYYFSYCKLKKGNITVEKKC